MAKNKQFLGLNLLPYDFETFVGFHGVYNVSNILWLYDEILEFANGAIFGVPVQSFKNHPELQEKFDILGQLYNPELENGSKVYHRLLVRQKKV